MWIHRKGESAAGRARRRSEIETTRKSITYLRQCVGATGQLLLVLRIIAGGLTWPTTGAEVRPWFLFPQRWPPTLLYPGIPGCGPLSLQARRENISRFLSSHFIIIAWIRAPARSRRSSGVAKLAAPLVKAHDNKKAKHPDGSLFHVMMREPNEFFLQPH